MKNKDFGPLFWLHITLIILAYASPFLFNYKFVFFSAFLYFMQLAFLRGCILSKFEFKNKEEGFYDHYLRKAGFDFRKEMVDNFVNYIAPAAIILTTIIWQIALMKQPLL